VKCTKLTSALSIVTLAFILAGCGGSQSADTPAPSTQVVREAAVAFKPDKGTCTERGPSYTYRNGIVNTLPFAIRLDAGEYDCNDWSGQSTPGHAFTGKILQPGETLDFVLEPVKYTTRWWTLAISPANGGAPFGTARLTMPQTGLDAERIEILGSDEVRVADHGVDFCQVSKMSQTDARATPKSDYPRYFTDSPSLGVVSHDGRVMLAGFCYMQGM